jgi:hypothetical protein
MSQHYHSTLNNLDNDGVEKQYAKENTKLEIIFCFIVASVLFPAQRPSR